MAISLLEVRRLLHPQKSQVSGSNMKIIDTWPEYEDGPTNERKLKYLCFEMETIDPQTGKKTHFYKAIKLARVIRVPKGAKQSTALMDMHTQVMTAVYEQGYNFICVIANIREPVALGLLFLYGVQGVATTLDAAKDKCQQAFVGLASTLQGTYRVLEIRMITAQETEWLREKLYKNKYSCVVRGIPKASRTGEDAGNKGLGGANLNPDSQGTLEEIITGMADYEYVIEVLTTPVHQSALKDWANVTRRQMTDWQEQMQGTKGFNFSLSIPMMYGANQGANVGNSKGYSIAQSQNFSQGTSYNMGYGENVGEALSRSYGQSFGKAYGQSFSESISQTHTVSQGVTMGRSIGFSQGVSESHSVGESLSRNESYSQGTSQNVSQGRSFGESVGQNQSMSQSQNIGQSFGMNRGQSAGYSMGQSQGVSNGMSTGRSQGMSFGQSVGQSMGQSASFGRSQSAGQSYGVSQSEGRSTGYSASQGMSTGQSFGTSSSMGQNMSMSRNQSMGVGSNQSYSQGMSQGSSQNIGTSMGTNSSQSMNVGHNIGTNESQSVSHGQSAGMSTSSGMSQSESRNISQSSSISQNESIGQSQNLSGGRSASVGNSANSGTSWNGGFQIGNGDSSSHSNGWNVGGGLRGDRFSLNGGVSGSDTTGHSDSFGVSFSAGGNVGAGANNGEGVSIGSSVGASYGYSQGQSQGISMGQGSSVGYNVSQGMNYSENLGESRSAGSSEGWSTGYGQSIGQSYGVNQSVGTSQSVSNSMSAGTSSSFSTGEGYSTGMSQSQGTSYGQNIGQSQSQSINSGMSQNAGQSWGQNASMSESNSYGETRGTSYGQNTGINQSESFSQNVGTSYGQNVGSSYSENIGTSAGQSFGASQGFSAGSSYGQNAGVSESVGRGTSLGQSIGIGRGYNVSTSVGTNQSRSESQSYSVSQSESWSTSHGFTKGESYTESLGESTSQGETSSYGKSKNVSQGQSTSTGYGTSESQNLGYSMGLSRGASASMGISPSLGYSKSYQWIDQHVKDIVEMLEYKNERLKNALRGNGAFYSYVYICTPSLDALAAAKALAKSTWQNEEAMIEPLQVLDLDEAEQTNILEHSVAFSADVTMEDPDYFDDYKYCTVLLPKEMVSYTHLPRISEGGLMVEAGDVPKFSVPSMLKGEIYLGTVLSPERYTLQHGYETPFEYRIDERELMHMFFTGASRSGKTVTAMRFIAELTRVRRKSTGKRLRIVCMDPKQDWRALARYVEPERFHFYNMGNTLFRPLHLNPLKIPHGVIPQMWIDGVIDIFCRAFGLLERGKQMMGETIYQLYNESGVFGYNEKQKDTLVEQYRNEYLSKASILSREDPDTIIRATKYAEDRVATEDLNIRQNKDHDLISKLSSKVTFVDVYHRMNLIKLSMEGDKEAESTLLNLTGQPGKGKSGNDTKDAYARLLDRLQAFNREFSVERQLFGGQDGMSVDELIGADDVTVIESKGLENTFKNFIFGVITSGFYKYALAHEGGFLAEDQYETLLVIEEANEVLTGSDVAGTGGGASFGMTGQSEFEQILDQSAGYGLFIAAITQKISDMPKSIIANAGLKFAGRLTIPDDVTTVIRSIAREDRFEDRDLVKWFPRSPTGWFVCMSSRTYDFKDSEPVLVKVARLNTNPPSNSEIEELLEYNRVYKSYT